MRRKKGLVGFELTGTLQSWYVESLSRILLVKKKKENFGVHVQLTPIALSLFKPCPRLL